MTFVDYGQNVKKIPQQLTQIPVIFQLRAHAFGKISPVHLSELY